MIYFLIPMLIWKIPASDGEQGGVKTAEAPRSYGRKSSQSIIAQSDYRVKLPRPNVDYKSAKDCGGVGEKEILQHTIKPYPPNCSSRAYASLLLSNIPLCA